MSKIDREREYPVSQALREEGYIPLPRLWVKSEDMERIYQITRPRSDDVNRIRNRVYGRPEDNVPANSHPQNTTKLNPIDSVEDAWAAYERSLVR